MTGTRRKLIEVSIPLEAINAASKKQKAPKGYPTAIHKYWAQRPIAACRAILFAQLVDDPSSWPDRFPTEEAQDAERRRLHRLLGGTKEAKYKDGLVAWESSNDERILNAARWEIARSVAWGKGEEPPSKDDPKAVLDYLQTKAPPVYDPFSGGGSIPLEAQRLGLRAYGSDINPVAVLIGKALVEIPPKFAGRAPVNPDTDAHKRWKGAQGLAEDVRHYGKWMRDEAERRIGHLYPKATLEDGSEATVIAWLWARTVRSPDPAARGAMVPLVSSFMLSTKKGRKAWAEIVRDANAPDGWRFEVKSGELSADEEKQLKTGTKTGRGSNFECVLTGASINGDHVKAEGKAGQMGVRLMAIVTEGTKRRDYLSPTDPHETVAEVDRPDNVPQGELPDDPRNFWTVKYGLNTFASLFTPRQLVALTTFSDLVGEARVQVLEAAQAASLPEDPHPLAEGGIGAEAYADAVATYLAFLISRAIEYGSQISTWLTDDNAIRGTFPRQALPMTWDYCEGNYFGKSSVALSTIIQTVSSVIEILPTVSSGSIDSIDSQTCINTVENLISTDPPYYDNIGYADLSDFFYIWLRTSINNVWPTLFRRLSTPKDRELVATPYRHGGKENAEEFFMRGMIDSIKSIRNCATSIEPITIYYAYKQNEIKNEGIFSPGWTSFIQAIVNSNLIIDGTWPIRSESPGRMIASGSNALASSIVLVCRKRVEDAPTISRQQFIRALRRELPPAIADIRKAGVGPVDMQQALIGPGMGAFSRNAAVLEDDDSAMSVRNALMLINRVWGEIESETDNEYDATTQVALAWFGQYGYDAKPSGELITLANAKNVSLDALFATDVFADLRGKAGLVAREKLPADWTPQRDQTLTVWECAQHTARRLGAEDGGATAAATLIAGMCETGAAARALVHRLFQIATDKGWASEALVWNELAQEWPRLEDIAAGIEADAAPAQGRMDV